MTIYYEESFIKSIKESYNYQTNLDNPYIIERSEELIDDNFMSCLKVIEEYEKKISIEIKKFSPKLNKNKGYQKYNNNNNKKNYNFVRGTPKERPITFLNENKGKVEELKKEINGNLNKLSNANATKIFEKILESYKKNIDIFDYNYFIDTLFDKAVMQPIYCPVYVRLFMTLRDQEIKTENNELKDDDDDDELQEDKLSLLIREKCDLFMTMITEFKEQDDDVLNPDNYDDFCDKNKKKVYKKGFSQFIGELYKNKFVDSQFIANYIDAISDNIILSLESNNINVENASICLVQLVETTINRRLFKNNKCFVKIRQIKNNPILPKKLKFKFMDLLGD